MPFRLNHVNIYLLADGDGWAMIDSGFGNEETIAAWTTLFEGPLRHVKISRLIVTSTRIRWATSLRVLLMFDCSRTELRDVLLSWML